MSMFIDVNAYVGHWPFRKLEYNTLAGLDRLARENGITHMVVANIEGFFYKDANRANLSLLEEWRRYNGKTAFLPLAIVNPTYPEWERDARGMICAGFAGFEIAPYYHFYSFGPEAVYDGYVHRAAEVLALAQELEVPVRVCTSVENNRARSRFEKDTDPSPEELFQLLNANRDAHVFVTGFHPGRMDRQLRELVRERKNTYFDLTAMAAAALRTDGVSNAVKDLAREQLCYGSLSPFQYMEPTLITLEYENAIDTEIVMNAPARAFHL